MEEFVGKKRKRGNKNFISNNQVVIEIDKITDKRIDMQKEIDHKEKSRVKKKQRKIENNQRTSLDPVKLHLEKTNKSVIIRATIDKKKLAQATKLSKDNFRVSQTNNKINIETTITVNPFLLDYMLLYMKQYDISLDLFGNRNISKEMSEAGAGIYYARKYQYPGKTRCYVIGEGQKPRVSIVLSSVTNWDIVSIDPLIDVISNKNFNTNIQFISDYDYNVDVSDQHQFDSVIIIGVHSHNNMKKFWKRIDRPKLLVYIPCCYEPIMDNWTDRIICDGIFSGKNIVYIWNSGKFQEFLSIVNRRH